MAGVYSITPVLFLASFVIVCSGSYVITTPREWLPGGELQVCVQVKNPQAPAGNVAVSIYEIKTIQQSRRKRQVVFPPYEVKISTVLLEPITFKVPSGNQHICNSISLPEVKGVLGYYWHEDFISVTGYLDGANVNHTGRIERQTNVMKTIIQTDKYLYKPGQTVQFRILSHSGPLMEISTEPYKEIYVRTPSRNRIAQWLDVDNSKGLVHLSMQLADETEEGIYEINIERGGRQGSAFTKFKVEEYVLPRFEVTVEGPKSVLGTDTSFSFSACAKYTFGEPVKGNISWEINNSKTYGCQVIFTKNDTTSGCSEITVMSSEVRMTDCQVSYVSAIATVTEDGTGVQLKGQGGVTISRNAISFETLRKDEYLKPNLPYTLKVLAKLPDDTPASGELLEVCHGGSCSNRTTPADGIIKLHLTNRESKRVVIQGLVTRAVMSVSKFSSEVKKFFSPSNSSLLIYAPEENLNCVNGKETNHVLPVLFSAVNQKSAIINVQVMSRGRIQYWKSEQYQLSASELPFEKEFMLEPLTPSSPDVVTGVINVPLKLPSTASPKAKVIVWYIRDDGEVVSDVKELTVEKCLPNTVDLSWSSNKTEPGQKATWKIASAPNSICSLGVVDKSVELLSSTQDKVTVDGFFLNDYHYELKAWNNKQANDDVFCRRKLETEIDDRFSHLYYSDYVDTLQMFDESGLYIFSDLQLETRPCVKQETKRFNRPHIVGGDGSIGTRIGGGHPVRIFANSSPHKDSGNRIVGGSGNAPVENTPRTDFPETWLWDLVVVPSSGSIQEELYVPDTITEWVGKAVCVHPQKGVGLSERTSLTTFTPFFVDLTLPPSIKRGEVLPVKISVFNYLQQALPVRIVLEASPEYDFVGENPEVQPVGQRLSCVGGQDKQVHTIKIQPNVIGEVNITVSAYVDTQSSLSCGPSSINVDKRDALVRPITVEAEGFLREKSWSKYICADEVAAGEDTLETTEVSVPSGMVEGSERAWVTAVGDLLAISLQHLGSLIRMPYGCGEQNMLNFAPNIFILQYLKATRQETPEATEKLLGFMRNGYQRQLLYRHYNGSYSAFGKADDIGSTWLTAFVLKSFSQAKTFILIDDRKLVETRDWLLDNYGRGTCAVSIGKVFHKGMKGGLGGKGSSPVPLTAYIVISLLESGINNTNPTVRKGLGCILSDNSSDSYTLALKAYALALAKVPSASNAIEQLLQQAIRRKNSTHWELPKGSGFSKPLEVETAGYALLAMMAYDPSLYRTQGRRVVKWISTQRNGRGGFYSTQDTVVALQALASFESNQYQGDLDVIAGVRAQGLSYSFNIKETNKLLQQQVSLPVLPTNVSFSMVGQGCAVLQTVLRYNDPEPESSDAFSLRVNTRTEPDIFCNTKRISACASYLLPDGVSNMAILEVNLVSGYTPEKEDLKRHNVTIIKRYEVDGSKVSFYINEFTAGEDVCINFRVVRQVDVENAKPGSVTVYDYYQPEFSVSKTYNLPVASECRYR